MFGDLFTNRGIPYKVINKQIIRIDCNNVHYHHPTLRVPRDMCTRGELVSSPCRIDDWKSKNSL